MKILRFFSSGTLPAALGILIASPVLAETQEPAASTPSAATKVENHTPTHLAMEAMNKAFRQLNRQAKEGATTEEMLKSVLSMQDSTAEAKKHLPPFIAKAPEADQPRLEKLYEDNLVKLSQELDSLKTAVQQEEKEKIQASIKSIRSLRGTSHEQLGVD